MSKKLINKNPTKSWNIQQIVVVLHSINIHNTNKIKKGRKNNGRNSKGNKRERDS